MNYFDYLKMLLNSVNARSLAEAKIPWAINGTVFYQSSDLPYETTALTDIASKYNGQPRSWDRKSSDFPQIEEVTTLKTVETETYVIGFNLSKAELEKLYRASQNGENIGATDEGQKIAEMRRATFEVLGAYNAKLALYGSGVMPGILNNPSLISEVLAFDPYTAAFDVVYNWVITNVTRVSVQLGIELNQVRILTNPTLALRFKTLANAVGVTIDSLLALQNIQVIAQSELYGSQLQANGVGTGQDVALFYGYGASELLRRFSIPYESPVVNDIFNLRLMRYTAQTYAPPKIPQNGAVLSKFVATSNVILPLNP